METNLKFNSAICTSREQSERLLALGLKKETADMAYEYKPKHLADTDTDKDWVIVAHSPCGTDIPAWSLHRLIGLLGLSKICLNIDLYDSPYEEIIRRIDVFIHTGVFNREYLEK